MSEAIATPLAGLSPPGYRLEDVIGAGATGIVHRAIGPHNEALALKIARAYDLSMISHLRGEIELLRRIRHPGIVGLHDSGVVRGLPWYTMDLLPGRTLAEACAKRPYTLDAAVELLAQLLEIVEVIHARGYVHGDLKPGNIFLRGDGTPIVGDLDLVREGTRGTSAGTPLYVAPEQIRGEALDARTDVYALGCLAHTLLTGTPPFNDRSTLLADHLQRVPARLDVPDVLADLIERMLAKRREERPAYARDVLTVLSPWRRGTVDKAPQKPHLYLPSLQGRRELLHRFRRFAPFNATGAGLLIAGESGVGKTAVAERLMTLLGEQGWRVIPMTAPANASALAPLGPLLQTMVDLSWVGGPELARRLFGADGGSLRLYHPSVGELPGIEAPAASELSTQTGRRVLFRDLENALRALVGEQRIALIVDNLHRADELTLAFLAAVLRRDLYDAGLLFVGLYRPEEANALAPLARCPLEASTLEPLSPDAVERMVADMLACPEPPRELLRAVLREAQGNPYYVTEFLHMAVDRGLLERGPDERWVMSSKVGTMPVPASIQALMDDRLAGLSGPARELIGVTALIGRETPTELVLASAALDPDLARDAIEELLRTRMLVPGAAQHLRFQHETVRRHVIERLALDPQRNERIARALEHHYYGHTEFPDRFEAIAHHWVAAGDAVMASQFFRRAGDHALARAAYVDAERHYRAALAATIRGDAATRGRLLFRLATAQHGAGHLDTAGATMLEALDALGARIPRTRRDWRIALWRAVVVRLQTPFYRPADPAEPVGDLVRAAAFMAERYYFANDLLKLYTMALTSVNAGNRIEGASNARPYAYLAFAAGTLRLRRQARRLLTRSREIAEQQREPTDVAYSWLATALLHAGRGHWTAARTATVAGLDQIDAQLDPAGFENLTSCLSSITYYQGRIEESTDLAGAFRQVAERRGNQPRQAWGWAFAARAALLTGDLSSAHQHLERARTLAGDVRDGFLELMIPSLLALTFARLDAPDAAQREAALALRRLSGGWATNFSTREAYMATASTFRLLDDRHGERQAVAELTRFAWLFPMAAPIARGYRARLSRRPKSARWERRVLADVARRGAAPDEALVRKVRLGRDVPPHSY